VDAPGQGHLRRGRVEPPGLDNVLGESPEHYPKLGLGQLPEVDLVVLPDEPYQFNQMDGPEAFPGMLCALVSERFLTWYGSAMVEAPQAWRRSALV
jgi:hypothetical protein